MIAKLLEIPLVYIHEFAHYITFKLLGHSGDITFKNILVTKYNKSYKSHITYSYNAQVNYEMYCDNKHSVYIDQILIGVAPVIFMYFFSWLIFCYSNVYFSILFLLYLILCRGGWLLSYQDLYTTLSAIRKLKILNQKKNT